MLLTLYIDAQGDEGHQDTAPRDRGSRSTDHERGQNIPGTVFDTLILHAGPIAEHADEINVNENPAFPAMKQRGVHTMNPLTRSTIHIRTGIPAERWEPGTVDNGEDKDRLRDARSGSGPVRVGSTRRKSMTTTRQPQSQSTRATSFHPQDDAGPSDTSPQPKFSIATVSSNAPHTESQNRDLGSIERQKSSTDYVKTADKILHDLSHLTATDHKDLDGSWKRFTSCIDRLVEFVSSVPESECRSGGLDIWIHVRIDLWKRVIIRKRDDPKSKPRVLAMMRCYMVAGEHLLRSAPNRQILRQCRIIRRDLDDKLRKAKWRDPRSREVQTVAGESGEEEEPGVMQ